MFESIGALLVFAASVYVIWKLFVIVGDMAERRGQHRRLWQMVALFSNPIGAMLLLWFFVSLPRNRD